MAHSRLELQALLDEILESDGRNGKAYFQEPSADKMVYPAILYSPEDEDVVHADNQPYQITDRWMLTVIDPKPDGVLAKKISKLPMCRRNRYFVAENLKHYVFYLYF